MVPAKKRCWICHRSEEQLRSELPDVIWAESLIPFIDIDFTGRIEKVEKRQSTDVWSGETYVRPGLPNDQFAFYEPDLDVMVIVKRSAISICHVCARIIPNIIPKVQTQDRAIKVMLRRQPKTLDLLDLPEIQDEQDHIIARARQVVQKELQRLEGEYPPNELKVLLAMRDMERGTPVNVAQLTVRTGLLAPQVIIALNNIQRKWPNLGRFFEESSAFIFNFEGDPNKKMDEVIIKYGENPNNKAILEQKSSRITQ